jgi:glycosyltransferase involved in cell wall biosynthesis
LQPPLHILAYVHSFEPGGVERVGLRLCDAWQSAGANVTVLLGRSDGAMRRDAPRLNYVRYPSGPFPTAWCETAWMILCLWRQVRSSPPDVIFCPGNSYTVVAVALRLLLGGRCPPIVAKVSNSLARHDMIVPVRLAYRLWLRLQGGLVTRWVSMAASMRTEIAAAMGAPEAEIAIIEDPALDEREALRLARARDDRPCRPETGQLFLSVGRLCPQKRFDLLIRAFALAAAPGDRLVILGEGPGRPRLEALARRLGVDQRMSLPGHRRDIAAWLAQADAFVLSSDYEGVPAVIIEAMAAGVPVVATHSSAAMEDLLDRGRLGRLVACGDTAALAQAMAEAGTAHPNVEAARAQAARFCVERAAPAYLKVMRAAASA